jgi:hypothetical protein
VTGRVALEHGREIGAHRIADGSLAVRGLLRRILRVSMGLEILAADLLGEVIRQRVLQLARA